MIAIVKRFIPSFYAEELYRSLRKRAQNNIVRMPSVREVFSQQVRGCDGIRSMRLVGEMLEMGLINKVERGHIVLNEAVEIHD